MNHKPRTNKDLVLARHPTAYAYHDGKSGWRVSSAEGMLTEFEFTYRTPTMAWKVAEYRTRRIPS